jgi:hypothetical protein
MTIKQIIERTIAILSPLIGIGVLFLDYINPNRAFNITLSGFIILVMLGTMLGIVLITFKDNDDAESS